MGKQQTCLKFVLLLALLSLVGGRHPFNFFDESFDVFVDCLILHNITHEEYEKFESYENKQNLLDDKVELKFKCNIDCQLQRQPVKWLNQEGRLDLQLMNATEEVAEAITRCMADAPNEQCAYSFKLVMCAYMSDYPVIDYDLWQPTEEELEELDYDLGEDLQDNYDISTQSEELESSTSDSKTE